MRPFIWYITNGWIRIGGVHVRRLICYILLLSLLSCSSAYASEYCFDGEPTYAYSDGKTKIGIQKIVEDELVYFVCDIRLAEASQLRTAFAGFYTGQSKSKREPVSVIAARERAVFAINADNPRAHAYGIIIRNGELVRKPSHATRHMLVVWKNGNMSIITERNQREAVMLADQLLAGGAWQTFEFGPALVLNSKATDFTTFKKGFQLISTRPTILEPRTAIGQLDMLRYIVIVADGRSKGYSKGMSLQRLQELFVQYGAITAFNLDGGGSTTLYFGGSVINRASSGAERSLSDILYIAGE